MSKPTKIDLDNYSSACKVLEVSEQASFNSITKQRNNLAIVFHPDKNPGNANALEKMKSINTNYGIIKEFYEKFPSYFQEVNPNFDGQKNEFSRTDYYVNEGLNLDIEMQRIIELFKINNDKLSFRSLWLPQLDLKPNIHEYFLNSVSCAYARVDPLVGAILLSKNTLEAFYHKNRHGDPALHFLLDIATRSRSASYLATCMLEYALDMGYDFLSLNKNNQMIVDFLPEIYNVDHARLGYKGSLYDRANDLLIIPLQIDDIDNSQSLIVQNKANKVVKTTDEIIELVTQRTLSQIQDYFCNVLKSFEHNLITKNPQERTLIEFTKLLQNENFIKKSPHERFENYRSLIEKRRSLKRNFFMENSLYSLRSSETIALYDSILKLDVNNLINIKDFEKISNDFFNPKNTTQFRITG